MAEGSRELQMWLGANVSEAYRAAVSAVADTLEDLRSSDLDELESVLALSSWPVLTRRRFVDAWRELKGEGAAAAPMAVEAPEPAVEPLAEPEPPAPAPRDEETLEPRTDGDWAATARELLREIKGENGNRHTNIEGLWPKLARYGFSATQAGICRGRGTIFPPPNFPKSTRKIKSLKGQNGLVEYLESALRPKPRPRSSSRGPRSSSRGPRAICVRAAATMVATRPGATTRGVSRAAHAAVQREITSLCHEMTEAVDLLVSPQLARQEIRVLGRSMTEEVDARAAAARLASAPSPVTRKAGVRWGAEEEAELRELIEEHHPTGLNEWRQIAELLGTDRSAAGVKDHWKVMRDREAKRVESELLHLRPVLERSTGSAARKGKWTVEEYEYTTRIIELFNGGLLELPEGVTLRAHLARKLNCDPMRITKKFSGEFNKPLCFSGARPRGDWTRPSPQQLEDAARELQVLEGRFQDACVRESRRVGFDPSAPRREIAALCHEMTEAVDVMVSPQLARQEVRALCRSMTEEVDAAAAPQLGRSLKRVARADFENWLADRKTRWRAERGYEYDSDFSEVDLDDLRERAGRHAAAERAANSAREFREITSLCREMTEAVDLLVSPQLARQEIRALGRSMTDEVDARVAPAEEEAELLRRLPARKRRWGAEEEVELRDLVAKHHPTGSNAWRQIAELLGTGRSASGVEAHWRKVRYRSETMSSPAMQPAKRGERARQAWTGACRACGTEFAGDGAWNTRAAHERTCGRESDEDDAPTKPDAAAAPEPDDAGADAPRPTAGAPVPEESADDEEAAVGRRVWALFEPDVWWGGTVVSIRGVEDKRMCSIIFDDGIPQTFYARDVWSSPLAGGKVGAREPNAAARAAIEKALSSTTPRLKPRKRPKRGSYAESSVLAPAPAPRRVTPVAPSGNCPICYDRLTADATVFECSHAMCASCSDSYAKSEVERSMSRRSGVSVACPLCRAPSKVVLPEEMHTSLSLGPTKRRRRSTDE